MSKCHTNLTKVSIKSRVPYLEWHFFKWGCWLLYWYIQETCKNTFRWWLCLNITWELMSLSCILYVIILTIGIDYMDHIFCYDVLYFCPNTHYTVHFDKLLYSVAFYFSFFTSPLASVILIYPVTDLEPVISSAFCSINKYFDIFSYLS